MTSLELLVLVVDGVVLFWLGVRQGVVVERRRWTSGSFRGR